MKAEESDFKDALEAIKVKELRSIKRATIFTVIPIVVGLVVFAFLAWQTVQLEVRKNNAIEETDKTRKEKEQLESSAKNARENLAETEKALDKANQALIVAKSKLTESKRNETAVRQVNTALNTVDAVGVGRWAVISGDKSLADAQDEVQKAQKLGYAHVKIYLRQNSYRTLVEFPTEADARAALSGIRARLSADAYLRDVDKWCTRQQERGGYFSCAD